MMRRLGCVISCLMTLLLTGACGMTATDLPLPGGGLSGDTYQITAKFRDTLNLPQKAKVTMDGVEIGQVADITAKGYTATVTMKILREFPLPEKTTFELRQATALGEVFIAATQPEKSTGGELGDGDVVPLARTGTAPSIEDTLAALSMLLNGGGLGNLKTIVDEINVTFDGRVKPTKSLIRELTTTASVLHSRQKDIDRVLVAMDSVAATAVDNEDQIDQLLDDVEPAVEQLNDQRELFVTMLRKFDRLARTGIDLLDANSVSAERFFKQLEPVLDGFVRIDGHLAPAMRQMFTFYEHLKDATRGSAFAGIAEIRGVNVNGAGGVDLP